MSDRSHPDDELSAEVREAERFVKMSDVELSAWMAREGFPAAAAAVRRFVNAAFKLGQQSTRRVKPRQQFEDAHPMDVCVKAAERIQNAMPTHQY